MRIFRARQAGFTLLELMIAANAVPAPAGDIGNRQPIDSGSLSGDEPKQGRECDGAERGSTRADFRPVVFWCVGDCP